MGSNISDRLAELREGYSSMYDEALEKGYSSMYDEALEIRAEMQRHLRRCPFCGDSPSLVINTNDHGDFVPAVVCSNCHLSMESTYVYSSMLEAMLGIDNVSDKWNNRFIPDEGDE